MIYNEIVCVCILTICYKSIYIYFSTQNAANAGGGGGNDTIGGAAGNTTQLNAAESKHSMMIVACHMLVYAICLLLV